MQMNAHFMQINEYKKSPIFPVYGIHASSFPQIMKIFSLHSLYLDPKLSLAPFFSKYDFC